MKYTIQVQIGFGDQAEQHTHHNVENYTMSEEGTLYVQNTHLRFYYVKPDKVRIELDD